MVPVSASWDLLPLHSFSTPDQLTRRLNEFATSRPRLARKASAGDI
jgi:hypothetical protein